MSRTMGASAVSTYFDNGFWPEASRALRKCTPVKKTPSVSVVVNLLKRGPTILTKRLEQQW